MEESPDLVINVINAANLERNLYLTLELTDFGIPMIIVLNMVDEGEKMGIRIDEKKLSEILKVPVVKTIASKGIGIDELRREIINGGLIPKKLGRNFGEKVKIAEEITKKVLKVSKREKDFNEMLDEVFMDNHLGIPLFLSIMWMMFIFTYNVAQPFVDALDFIFTELAEKISGDGWLFHLLGNGVVKGVGSVLIFLPNIAFLFIFLSLLELSGYMPRAVYLADPFMSKFGLSGRSIIPLIMGFGCNVPAILSTRSIEDNRVRIATLLINPFMSCSARLPIYVLFVSAFFPKSGSVVIMGMYLAGIAVALMSALLFRKTLLRGETEFIIELPPYRMPILRDVWILTWNGTKHFLVKAGTIILAMSIVLWFITNYPSNEIEKSFAGVIGKALQPLFSPMGWDYKLVLPLVVGFIAKEVVIETIGVMGLNIEEIMTPAQALGFMIFTLLYMPCFATIGVIKTEAGVKWAIFSVIYSFLTAYILAFTITEVGSWLV